MESSNHWRESFFSSYWGGGWGGGGGGGVNGEKQIYGHYQRKNSFNFYIVSFNRAYAKGSLANFKRVASSHEKLYNEQRRIFVLMLLSIMSNNTSIHKSQ